MSDRVPAQTKNSATPSMAAQPSSSQYQRPFTDERYEPIARDSRISTDGEGIQAKTIRQGFNWQNISVEAPNRSGAYASPQPIQRQPESEEKPEDLQMKQDATIGRQVSADSEEESPIDLAAKNNSTRSIDGSVTGSIFAKGGFNLANMSIFPPAKSVASQPESGGIQRQQAEEQKEQEDATDLQMQPDGAIQLKCSECEKEEKQENINLKPESETKEGQNLTGEEEQDQNQSIQTKLTVGAPGDKYEQEADSMAAKVMTMPDSAVQQPIQRTEEREKEEIQPSPLANSIEREKEEIQPSPLANSITPLMQRQTAEDAEALQMKPGLQRATDGSSQASGSVENRLAGSKGGGSALPDDTRSFMEPRFGADLSSIKVHTDSNAVQMNKELGAQAFAHGSDIYYGAGKSPGKNELTAHELTHTIQQTGGVQPKLQTPSEAPSEPASSKTDSSGNEQTQTAVTTGDTQTKTEPSKVESGKTEDSSQQPGTEPQAQQKGREAKENAAKSGKPKSDPTVEIVPQQGKSAAKNGSETKAEGETRPAEAVKAAKPQEKIQLPKEAKTPDEGEKTKDKQSQENAKQDGKGESKALEKVPQAQALKEATAGNEKANQNAEGNKAAANPESEAEKQKGIADAQAATTQLEATNAEVAQLASAGINFAPPEQKEAGEGEEGAVVAQKAEQPSGNSALLEQQRAQASTQASNFLAEAAGKVQTITGLGPTIQARILGATGNAKATVMEAVEQQKAAVTAQIAQQRSQAQSEAQATIAQIQAQHQAAAAAIPQTTATARQQVETENKTALQTLDDRVNNQIKNIGELYNQAGKKYRDAGPKVGDEAVARAEERAKDYESKITGKDDNFWDGPLKDNRNKARAKAAREVGKQYKQGLIDEANKQADKVQEGKPKDIEAVHQIAKQSRETLKTHHKASLDSLKTAQKQALSQMKEAQTNVTEAANNSLQATLQSLDQQQAMQLQLLTGYGQREVSAIERDAQKAIASLQDGINQAAASLQSTIKDCQSQLQGMPAPNPEELSAALAEILGQVDSSVAKVQKQTEQGITASEQGIAQGGQQVVGALTGIAQSGLQESAAVVEGAKTTLSNLNQGATDCFKQIQEAFTTIVKDTTNAAVKGFGEITKGIDTTFKQVNQNLESGIENSVADLEQGLRGALDKMDADIHKYAEEAAAKEEPRGVKVFKIFAMVLLVVVVIAAAIVFAPAVIGAVGTVAGLLGASAAVANGIGLVVGGAIVGVAASAVIQMGSNLINGKPIFENIGKAMLAGAIAGALGGAGGLLGNVLAQAGKLGTGLTQLALRVGIDVAFDIAGGVFGTLATGDPITLEGILIGAGIAAGVSLGTAKESLSKLGRFGSSVEGMQTSSFQAGERFGTSVGDKIKSGFGGGVDAPTVSRPDVDMPGVKPPDTGVKAPDTGVKPPETDVKAPETRVKPPQTDVKAPETQVKPPQTDVKAPETQVKPPKTDTPNGRSTHIDKPEVEPGVVAKDQTADGREIKVTKEGEVLRCFDCPVDNNPKLKEKSDPQEKIEEAKKLDEESAASDKKRKADTQESGDTQEFGESSTKKPKTQESTIKTDEPEIKAEKIADFRSRIDSAPNQEAADNVRYERYKYEQEQEGRTPSSRDRWQVATDRLRANQARGRENEDAALESAGVQNNNYNKTPDGQPRNPITYETTTNRTKDGNEQKVATRPDGVTDSKWVDVKSIEKGTVDFTQQLRAQKEGAVKGHPDGRPRDLAVVIANKNPTAVRPSGPLADNATVVHRNSETKQWSVWNEEANQGQGGWTPITPDQAASALGGKIPEQ